MSEQDRIEVSATGAKQSSRVGKGRYDLSSPYARRREAALLEYGARTYGEHNAALGIPMSRHLDSVLRHLTNYMLGIPDPDHGDNLAAAYWRIGQMMEVEERVAAGELPRELKDVPYRRSADTSGPLRVYVAGPYSDSIPAQRRRNALVASWYGLQIQLAGHYAYVPHTATMWWDGYLTYEQFMSHGREIITRWANCVFCCGSSPGADREVQMAKELALPVYTELVDIPGMPKHFYPELDAYIAYWSS